MEVVLAGASMAVPFAAIIYLVYLAISSGMTIWVGSTLHKNGRMFLVEAFHDNESQADAVNRLLLVGFYLVNFGFVLLFLRIGAKPSDLVEGIEYSATKLGVVLFVLGGMHFFNMFNFDRMRKRARSPMPTPA